MQANGETDTAMILGIVLAIVALLVILRSIRLTQEWRRAVVLRLGLQASGRGGW